MRFLVAGCGYLGSRVAKTLSHMNAEIVAIRSSKNEFPQNVSGLVVELGIGKLKELGPFDGIVFCLAARESTEEAYKAAYVDSLKEVLAKTTSPKVVFISSTAVYQRESDDVLTEDSPTLPESFRGEVLLEAEKLVSNYTIARAGGLYGPGRLRYLKTEPSDAGSKVIHRIHVEDLANFCVCSIATESIPKGIYNLVDNHPSSGKQICDWLKNKKTPQLETADRVISNNKLSQVFSLKYPDFRSGYEEALNIS